MRVHHTIVLAISMHGDDYTVLQVGDNEDVSNNDRGTVVVVVVVVMYVLLTTLRY